MPFQSSVSLKQGFGVVGELFDDGPRRAWSYILRSVSAANNVFGRAFTVKSEGVAECGNPSGTAVFAGILVNPKVNPLLGTSSGTLAPSLTLPNETQGELLTEGSIIVSLPAAAAIGDVVIFDNTTGALSTIAPGADLPANKSPAHAVVSRFTVSGAGLAVIDVLAAPYIPVPAP
jgi:hypothetical protein